MTPSDAPRPERFSPLVIPRWRSRSTAFSRSPLVSSSAFLQSIIPAPVRTRSAATSFAVIFAMVLHSLLNFRYQNPRLGHKLGPTDGGLEALSLQNLLNLLLPLRELAHPP